MASEDGAANALPTGPSFGAAFVAAEGSTAFSVPVDGAGIKDPAEAAALGAGGVGIAPAGDGRLVARGGVGALAGDDERVAGALGADDAAAGDGASARVEGDADAVVAVDADFDEAVADSVRGTAACRAVACAFEADGIVSTACGCSAPACGNAVGGGDGAGRAPVCDGGVASDCMAGASAGSCVAIHVAVATASAAIAPTLSRSRRRCSDLGFAGTDGVNVGPRADGGALASAGVSARGDGAIGGDSRTPDGEGGVVIEGARTVFSSSPDCWLGDANGEGGSVLRTPVAGRDRDKRTVFSSSGASAAKSAARKLSTERMRFAGRTARPPSIARRNGNV
jgi:hypothetical protein